MKVLSIIASALLTLSIILGSARILARSFSEPQGVAATALDDQGLIEERSGASAAEPSPAAGTADSANPADPSGELMADDGALPPDFVDAGSYPDDEMYPYDAVDTKGKAELPPIAEFTDIIHPRSGPIIPGVEYLPLLTSGNPIFRTANPPNVRGPDPCPAGP